MVLGLDVHTGRLILLILLIPLVLFFVLSLTRIAYESGVKKGRKELLYEIDIKAISAAYTIVEQKFCETADRDELLKLHDLLQKLDMTIRFLGGEVPNNQDEPDKQAA